MTITNLRATGATLLTIGTLLALTPLAPSIAMADDNDLICFEYQLPNGDDELECDTRGNYKAECALTDPDNTTEFCQDINSAFEGRDEAPQSLVGGGGGTVDPTPPSRPLSLTLR
ncbi:hypothetical protein NIM87_11585 [Devosia sp. XJ19-1]|uniref:DUF3551 domain-containing protein n=1 Tax=Devosia ureilytica TaxID=2952754 RepID=A0A9Q4FTD7_9HYPH|nr:hypothetical protein [Devosia ureilytica]MCP8884147.1 hypothetical protein [Devosia ureilytica]MCP8887755.1 hypothetical protein [Devosia ureilytica]